MENHNIVEHDVDTWVRSLDREVTSLGRTQASMRARLEAQESQLNRVEDGVDRLLESLSKPKPPMQLIAGIGGIAAVVAAFAVFIELRMAPSEALLELMYNNLVTTNAEFTNDIGELQKAVESDEASLVFTIDSHKHLDEMHHETVRRLNELVGKVGKLEATAASLSGSARDKKFAELLRNGEE